MSSEVYHISIADQLKLMESQPAIGQSFTPFLLLFSSHFTFSPYLNLAEAETEASQAPTCQGRSGGAGVGWNTESMHNN